jgi:hypothetical protein
MRGFRDALHADPVLRRRYAALRGPSWQAARLTWSVLSPRCSDTGSYPPLTQNGDASFVLTTKSRSQEASP